MKTRLFSGVIFCMVAIPATCQKQAITLIFTSQNQGSYVTTDSIAIRNLTRNCDTTLYYPDTVLVLDMISGLKEPPVGPVSDFRISTNYPNPFTDQTTFQLFMPECQKVRIEVYDQSGKELIPWSGILARGLHLFTFAGRSEGFYLLRAWVGKETRTITMIHSAGDQSPSEYRLMYNGCIDNKAGLKQSRSFTGFSYATGDSLRFIGYGRTTANIIGSDIMFDSPVQNQFYIFVIAEGLPCPGMPTVNYEGKVYTTRQISSQCWMRENLDAGVRINAGVDQTDNGIIEKYCYQNFPSSCAVYGGLYQWNEAMQYAGQQGVQGICPPGWHLPTDDEWTSLTTLLGGANFAGGHLKEAGFQHWYPPNIGADDSVGFNALPAGMYFDGGFDHVRTNIEYWSSTESYGPYAWYRILYNDNSHFVRTDYYEKTTARSVRCIRDN